MTTKYTDTATRGGNKWFHRWLNGHMAVFAVGGWIGYYLSTFLWWRHLDIVNDFGRWGHSFWHSMLVVVPLGYLFHVLQMKWQRRSEQKEAEQVAAANAKTPEEEAIERAEYLAWRLAPARANCWNAGATKAACPAARRLCSRPRIARKTSSRSAASAAARQAALSTR